MFAGWPQWYDWLLKIGGGALVGGLLVNEVKRRIEKAGENRKYLGEALSDLLEIRYCMAVTRMLKRELERVLGDQIPAGQVGPIVHAVGPQILQFDWSALQARYNRAVSALAGVRPLLAYELRSRDRVGPLLQQLGNIALHRPPVRNSVEAALQERTLLWLDQAVEKIAYGLPNLGEAALRVARKHGWRTLRATKRALKRQDSMESTTELAAALEALKSQLAEVVAGNAVAASAAAVASASATSTTQPPPRTEPVPAKA